MSDVVKALAGALPQLGNVATDAKSHHGRYATLANLLDHVRPVLAEHGLGVLQTVGADGLRTLFVHTSGEVFDAGTYPLGTYPNPQAQGSALSYARRYALLAACGVAAHDDDDGNTATRFDDHYDGPEPYGQATSGKNATANQLRMIGSLFAERGVTDRAERLDAVSGFVGRDVASSKALTVGEASAVIDRLKAWPVPEGVDDVE